MTSGSPGSGGLKRARPGKLEQTVARELKEASAFAPPWVQTLHELALLNARMIDQARLHGPLNLVSPLEAKLLDVLDRIRTAPPVPPKSPADDVEAFINDLGKFPS